MSWAGWLHEALEMGPGRMVKTQMTFQAEGENQVKIQLGLCMMRSRDVNKVVCLEQSDDGLCIGDKPGIRPRRKARTRLPKVKLGMQSHWPFFE